MGSTLSGLFKTLRWTEFHKTPPSLAPRDATGRPANAWIKGPTVTVPSAFHFQPVQDGWRLTDPFNVNIAPPQCGYNESWSLRTQDEIDDALNHEQGHFNLTALLARDFFVDVMLLKQETFASQELCIAKIDAIKND